MDVFDLTARLALDKTEYETGLNDAKGSASSFASTVGNGLKTVAKVGATALTAAAAGVTALAKMGVEGYAQYEQLVGGVETLFKTSQDVVMGYAENAYMTAGLSANEYMETVTSFSASLIQSLGGDTAKAAEVGNMAITDMSDNANKMGTSMEMIQNAYNGFAKGNYTMLDNLKLGFGGTKEEMQRLLDEAEKISGIKYDISSFADITEAIHVMQEEMGIAGTTAREAATTIEGSISMMKGAWQNLVVGMADENANMEVLINNFVESVATAASNLLPRIEIALAGIGQLVANLAPVIVEKLPELVSAVLPSLLTAAASLLVGLAQALPELAMVLVQQIPVIIAQIRSALESAFPELEGPFAAIEGLFNGIWESMQIVWESIGKPIFDAVSGAFSAAKEAVSPYIESLMEYLSSSEFAADATNAVTVAVEALTAAYDFAASAVTFVIDGFKSVVEWGKEHETVIFAIKAAIATLCVAIAAYNAVQAIQNAGGIAQIAQLGILQVQTLGLQVAQLAQAAATAVATAATTAFGAAMAFLTSPITLVVAAIGALIAIVVLCVKHWDDIKEAAGKAWDWISEKTAAAVEWLGGAVKSIGNFFSGLWDGVKNGAGKAWDGIKSVFSNVTSWFGDVFSKAWQKVKDVFSTGGKVFDGIKDGIVSVFKTVVNALIGGINKVIAVPLNAINTILGKIKAIEILGIKPFDWIWTFNVPQIPKLSTGLNYVPFDEYPALLHRGEAVLTAAEARSWRNGQMAPAMAGGITINQYIQSVPQTPVEMAAATEAYFEQARWIL